MDGRRIARTRSQRGLTLLELLVVITILALVTSVAIINAPPPRSSAKDEAERFAARLVAAGENAVLDGAVMSVEVTPSGYGVRRYASGEWRSDDRAGHFKDRTFAKGVVVSLKIKDAALANRSASESEMKDKEKQPQRIVLDPVGALPGFSAEFSDNRERWYVSGGDGRRIEVTNRAES